MNDLTLMRLLRVLSECEPATIAAVADDSGICEKTVRYGLQALEQRGVVRSHPHYSFECGRPPIVYSLTPKGKDLAPIMIKAIDLLSAADADAVTAHA